ncbi:MAG: hypothetical protein IT195_01005 [Microthrixaceae bacterium]|nr:hypothetical protein [Microthrixaceae bacterium]
MSTLLRTGEAPEDVEARLASGIQRHVYDAFEASDPDEEPASFAFVVPSRLTRGSADFAHEGDELFPIAGLLDPVTKQLLWSSLCPWCSTATRDHRRPPARGRLRDRPPPSGAAVCVGSSARTAPRARRPPDEGTGAVPSPRADRGPRRRARPTQHVERIGELCRSVGTTVAPPQRWRRLI